MQVQGWMQGIAFGRLVYFETIIGYDLATVFFLSISIVEKSRIFPNWNRKPQGQFSKWWQQLRFHVSTKKPLYIYPTLSYQYTETFLEYKYRGICYFLSTVQMMAPCNHILLLQVVKKEQISFVNNERIEKLVNKMAWNSSLTVQCLFLQFFGEREAKNLAICQIFPQNNIR